MLKELEELTKREGNKIFFIEALMIQGLLKKAELNIPGAIDDFELVESLALECGYQPYAKQAKAEAIRLKEQTLALRRYMYASPEEFEQVRIKELISYIEGVKQQVKQSNQ